MYKKYLPYYRIKDKILRTQKMKIWIKIEKKVFLKIFLNLII
jgi:hypothetical protein